MKGFLKEKQIENLILSWLKFNNIMAWKIKTTGTYDTKLGRFRKPSPWYRTGVSDILGIYKKRPLAIEVKSKTGRVSPHQEIFLNEFRENGGIAFIATSVEDVQNHLEVEDLCL